MDDRHAGPDRVDPRDDGQGGRARLAWRADWAVPDWVDGGPLRAGGRVQGSAGRLAGQPAPRWQGGGPSTTSAFITWGCKKLIRMVSWAVTKASGSCTSWVTTPQTIPPTR